MPDKGMRNKRKGGQLLGGGKNQRKQLEAIGYGLEPVKPNPPKKKAPRKRTRYESESKFDSNFGK